MSIDTLQSTHIGIEECTVEDHQVIRQAVIDRNEQINTRFGSSLGRIATVGEIMNLLPESSIDQPSSDIGKLCIEFELRDYYTHIRPVH